MQASWLISCLPEAARPMAPTGQASSQGMGTRTMALKAQASMHLPQLTQRSGAITERPPSIRTACFGQPRTQDWAMQPRQALLTK